MPTRPNSTLTRPVHVPGTIKGEEFALRKGREPSRGDGKQYRGSQDATGIRPEEHQPIDPRMPSIPPA